MATPEKHEITLNVTQEQERILQDFFNSKGWNYDSSDNEPVRKRRRIESSSQDETENTGPSTSQDERSPDTVTPELEEGACPYCFLNPCVSTGNQNAPWIGPGQAACPENSGIRKQIYKRFWKCIVNLGAWDIPQYLMKKQRRGGPEYHVRQVMPECVLDLAMNLYPNPKGVPYMDHKWEF